MKVSVVAFNVDGLNLAEKRFYFLNNSLAFGRPKKIPPAITEKFGFKNLDENICVAVVKLQKEFKTQESGSMPMAEYLKQNYDYTWPALIILRIFLACYHLINGGQMPEIIYHFTNLRSRHYQLPLLHSILIVRHMNYSQQSSV